MSNISSINFKPTKLSIQEKHNDRSITPSYVLKSGGLGVECNRDAKEARALRDSLVEQAKINYKQYCNQPFKATPGRYLWSAVVNVKPDTTMQDLENLADHFKTKHHFQCYQIAIHRDEGHIDEEGVEHINHHAHLEFVTLDENTGKSMFRKGLITNAVLGQIQQEVADILNMQRGVEKRISGAKRIEPRAYAQLMEQEKAKRLELENNNATLQNSNNSLTKEVSTYREQIQDLQASVKNTQAELHTLKQEKTNLEQAHATLQQANTTLVQEKQTLTQENQELKDHNTELEATLIYLASLVAPQDKQNKKLTLKEAKTLLESVRKQMIALNQGLGDLKLFTQEDYKALRALKDEGLSIAELKARIGKIEKEAKTRYEVLQEQYKDHLSPKQVENKISIAEAKYKDYLSPSAVQELRQKHTKELENSRQEIATLQAELKSAKAEAKIQSHIKVFEKEAVNLIRKYVAPVTSGVVAHIQASGEKITEIHKQCQEEMIQQASTCALLNEEMLAGKHTAINAIARLFGKGVKKEYKLDYDPIKAKTGYRELNRREQAIKDKLADTLTKHSQAVQAINNQACQVILEAVESVKGEITKLATEFKSSAEYGAELNQAKRQIENLERDKERLQGKVSALEKEKETNKQEVEKAKANNEAFEKKGAENTRLKDELQTTKTTLETTQKDLETTKAELEATKAQLESVQSDLGALEILEGVVYAKIAEIGKTSPEVAQTLEIKASNALNDLASLREELPRVLAQVKVIQEQQQKGGGGYHK